MIDPNNLYEWQRIDPQTRLIMPWLTHPFLDILTSWDLSDKTVFEYGCGASTIWWASRVKKIYSVDSDPQWLEDVRQRTDKPILTHAPITPGEVELKSPYVQAIYQPEEEFDIVVVDGSYRDECVAAALTKVKDGGIIICDNWNQDYVWDSIMAQRLLAPYESHIFVQPGHTNHEGRPWKTAYFKIDKKQPHLLQVTGDYDSHRPMLWMALEHIKPGAVVEMGMGYGSTPVLEAYSNLQGRPFNSYETNQEWAVHFPSPHCHLVDQYPRDQAADILFLDCAPAEERKDLLQAYADQARVIIVHDTQEGAEHVYQLSEVLNSFKFRCDLDIEGLPRTTIVSQYYDFERWKGLTMGKFKFQ